MNSNRLWAIGSALFIVVLLAGTFFLAIAPQLDAMNRANLDRDAVIAQNAVEQAKLDELAKEDKNKESLKKEVDGLQAAIPDLPNLNTLISQIDAMGGQSGVFIQSIVFDEPVTYLPPADIDPALSGAASTVSSGNLTVIPVTVLVQSPDYNQVMDFLDRLQHSKRYLLVYEFNVAREDTGDGGVNFKLTITGEAYVLGDSPVPVVDPTVTAGADGGVPQ